MKKERIRKILGAVLVLLIVSEFAKEEANSQQSGVQWQFAHSRQEGIVCTDDGITWTQTSVIGDVTALAADPSRAGILYAYTPNGRL